MYSISVDTIRAIPSFISTSSLDRNSKSSFARDADKLKKSSCKPIIGFWSSGKLAL
jgi:hypothetical protein